MLSSPVAKSTVESIVRAALVAAGRELEVARLARKAVEEERDAARSEEKVLREKLEWQAACTKALMESQERLAAEVRRLRNELVEREDALTQDVDVFRAALLDLAERRCAYGDGCPMVDDKHGRCIGCKARAALEARGVTTDYYESVAGE
jgi:predicted  nucleic acid-binding Zn-ribbon protein